jgi:3-deoxy-7-phosphoheptulonate synthase
LDAGHRQARGEKYRDLANRISDTLDFIGEPEHRTNHELQTVEFYTSLKRCCWSEEALTRDSTSGKVAVAGSGHDLVGDRTRQPTARNPELFCKGDELMEYKVRSNADVWPPEALMERAEPEKRGEAA